MRNIEKGCGEGNRMVRTARSLVLVLGLAGAALAGAAETPASQGYDLLGDAFEPTVLNDIQLLNEQAMQETEGELWPFIAAVVATDVALASFFWGVYVPAVTEPYRGGVCTMCGGRNHIPR